MRIAVIAAVLAAPHVAAGDGHAFASGGGTFGATLDAAGAGAVLGGELSAGWFQTAGEWPSRTPRSADTVNSWALGVPDVRQWAGGYADAVYDTSLHHSRLSFGPEYGRNFLGVDGGLVMQLDDRRVGGALRLVATFGFGAVFARGERFFDHDADASLVELGVLIKLPWPF
ncbi:MAG TPA: hypothetical protein VGG74_13540 [Kofleriaceae bacterium]|jgi:hypothetical protein